MKKILLCGMVLLCLISCGKSGSGGTDDPVQDPIDGNATAGEITVTCNNEGGSSVVQRPNLVRNIKEGETGWFAAPIIEDLNGDGKNELITALYSLYVYNDRYELLDQEAGNGGRIYAPHIVTDLEGDGIMEVIVGQRHEVYAYEWRNELVKKSGWPADTTCKGNAPEVRGLAAADLDHDGLIEIVATTTQTLKSIEGGSQVYVFAYNGKSYQPKGISYTAWPRYNARSGLGGDADRNGQGHNGFGCYGLNVGIGNIDEDTDLEILATYDNHHIQAFKTSGEAIDAAPYFKNRNSNHRDMPMTWGQFIRWADPGVEEQHYHQHQGTWPNPGNGDEWLQFTASPPSVYDLDGDGDNEVIAIPNIEKDDPYVTQAYGVMVLEGAHGDGSRSAMRKSGWETLKRGGAPMDVVGWYPPSGIPAPAFADLENRGYADIIASLNDGSLYAFNKDGSMLWQYNYLHGKNLLFASEPTIADLNRDAVPEIIFTTFGDPNDSGSGYLMILSATGALLHDIPLPNPGNNGNGNGAPSAPTIGDLDGDGELEIIVQTFDHGVDVFSVQGSGKGCLLWSTSRGGPLRMGKPNGNK